MNTEELAKLISPEVVEAAARAIHAQEYDEAHYPFDREDAVQQSLLRSQARAAISAALASWPGMVQTDIKWRQDQRTGYKISTPSLILPLTEARDE